MADPIMTRAEAEQVVLRWSVSPLGHTVIVVVDDEDPARLRRTALYTCDKHRAIFAARTEYAEGNPVVYERTRRRTWKRVYGKAVSP